MTTDVLQMQINRLRPWVPAIRGACVPDPAFPSGANPDPFTVAALLLRESGAGWGSGYWPAGDITGTGDGGNAVTPFQFDLRDQSNREWWEKDLAARTREGQAARAVMYLREGYEMLRWSLSGDILWRAMIAAYNGDARKVLRAARAGDPDLATTGRDYSRWVVEKAAALKERAPDLFDNGGVA
jgi:hypothetical protein